MFWCGTETDQERISPRANVEEKEISERDPQPGEEKRIQSQDTHSQNLTENGILWTWHKVLHLVETHQSENPIPHCEARGW